MNSLTDLNNFSKIGFLHQDDRPAEYTFTTPADQTITIFENEIFNSPVGCDPLRLISIANTLSYTVNVSSLSGASVAFNSNSQFTTSNVGGVYTLSGIRGVSDWNQVSAANVVMPLTGTSNVTGSYVSTINYPGGSKTWQTNVTINQMEQLTSASNHYYPSFISSKVLGPAFISNLGSPSLDGDTYTCNITPNTTSVMGNLSSTGTLGGTSDFIWGPKTLSIHGNMAQVNSHLNNLYFWPLDNVETTFTLQYDLYNNSKRDFHNVQTQSVRSQTGIYMTTAGNITYDKNKAVIAMTHPTINDEFGNALATYTMQINSVTGLSIESMQTYPINGVWNDGAKTLTLTGNKATVNSMLGNLTMRPVANYVSNFQIQYMLLAPDGNVTVRRQNALISSTANYNENESTTISNTTYMPDSVNLVSGAPQLRVLIPPMYSTYVATITSNAVSITGALSSNSSSGAAITSGTTMTISGTFSQVNDGLSHIYFTSPLSADNTLSLAYDIQNVEGNWHYAQTQTLTNITESIMTRPTSSTFDKNVLKTITAPTITSSESGTFTMVISPTDPLMITSITSAGSGGTTSFVGNAYTITGTKAQVNSHLAALSMQPATELSPTSVTKPAISLKYRVTTPAGYVGVRSQTFAVSVTETFLASRTLGRTYVSNTAPQSAWAGNAVPQILETMETGTLYNLAISSVATGSYGKFGQTDTSNAFSYTETGKTKAEMNTLLTNLKFYPVKDMALTKTFTVTLTRSTGGSQTTTVNHVGSARGTSIVGNGNVFVISYPWVTTFTYEQINYLKADVLMAAADGGTGASGYAPGSGPYRYGGGGGGGGVCVINNAVLSDNVSISIDVNGNVSMPSNITGSSIVSGGTVSFPTVKVTPGENGGSYSGFTSGAGGKAGLVGPITGSTVTYYGGLAGGAGEYEGSYPGFTLIGGGGGGFTSAGAAANHASAGGGLGGNGIVSTITGSSVTYGAGNKSTDTMSQTTVIFKLHT